MSGRVTSPPHLQRWRILVALVYGMDVAGTRGGVVEAARAYLRGQGLRVSVEEVSAVLETPVAGILFPECACKDPDDHAGVGLDEQAASPGPHHKTHCPSWRAVRP